MIINKDLKLIYESLENIIEEWYGASSYKLMNDLKNILSLIANIDTQNVKKENITKEGEENIMEKINKDKSIEEIALEAIDSLIWWDEECVEDNAIPKDQLLYTIGRINGILDTVKAIKEK